MEPVKAWWGKKNELVKRGSGKGFQADDFF